MGNSFENLNNEIKKFNDVLNTMNILIWDSRTKMPKKGASGRGSQIGSLTSVAREILLSSKMRKLFDESDNETHNLNDDTCYKYKAKEVSCPTNKDKITKTPVDYECKKD